MRREGSSSLLIDNVAMWQYGPRTISMRRRRTKGHVAFERAILAGRDLPHGAAAAAARKLKLTPDRISRIRAGGVPRADTLRKIQRVYGVPAELWGVYA